MKLAMLGVDSWLELAAESATSRKDCEVAIVCGTAEESAGILAGHPQATLQSDWESLLLGRDFDILLVGTHRGSDDERAEQLRRFVQESVPLLVVHPAAEAIVLHELAMIQHDTQSVLVSWNPVLAHPVAVKVLEVVSDAHSGSASHVSFQRAMDEPRWEDVIVQASRDAQWVRHLIGPPDRVTALAPASESGVFSNLSITFVGPGGAMAQWSLAAAEDDAIVVETRDRRAQWKLTGNEASELLVHVGDAAETKSWSVQEVRKAQGEDLLTMAERALNDPAQVQNFDEASRAVELAEAAHESNRRSRTIHLHYEEHSEQQTFKSVMAAGGCLLLLATLCLLGGSIMVDSIGAPVRNNPWWRMWPVYLLAPVVVFLLLQTLWRVFATAKR